MKNICMTLENDVMLRCAPDLARPFTRSVLLYDYARANTCRYMDEHITQAHGRVLNDLGYHLTRHLHYLLNPL